MWSISASVSSTAWSGVARSFPGCRPGKASNWARMSGEALNRNHRSRSGLTAIDDWVRARAGRVPFRTARQVGQLQFHCG